MTLTKFQCVLFSEDRVLEYYKKSAGQTRGESVVR